MWSRFVSAAFGAVALVLLAMPSVAGAVVLLGNDFRNARLYDINPATGAASNPRATGIDPLVDIEYDPGKGILWGLSQTIDALTESSLFRINITGGATLVGITGLRIIEGDLALDPVSGVLYGVQHQRANGTPLELFTINTATGAATVVGTVAGTDLSAMSFDNSGNLFILDSGADRLLRVDPATGAVLGNVALSLALGGTVGMDVDPSTGIMYAADRLSNGTGSVYILNTATGVLDLLGPTGPLAPDGLAGLTVLSAPEPGTLSLLALACAGAAGFGTRRRLAK